MNKYLMRDIIEKHAEDYYQSLLRHNVEKERATIIKYGILDFVSSKQAELYDDLYEVVDD